MSQNGSEVVWTREFPSEPGKYWFYGWEHGQLSDLAMSLVHVEKFIDGCMLYVGPTDIMHRHNQHHSAVGYWTPAHLPDPPADFNLKQPNWKDNK